MEMEIDHYVVLGLPSGERGAKLTDADIKKAYKTKALELHPDKRPDDPNANINFLKLTESYEILKDETQRKILDDRVQRQRQSSKLNAYLHKREGTASLPADIKVRMWLNNMGRF
ncbi:hypothetical protein MKW94_004418 [Papaver nudicaule]|uniref:J domain-containing protein n=1 Tax=Papaver nudicaule TaxID=74823 RepID=A0AA41V014_PAPNU|nr:hypothetical protein [Papaver nudicaule]